MKSSSRQQAENLLTSASLRLTRPKRLYGVMGGLHLSGEPPERISLTIEAFKRYDVRVIAPARSTGGKAMAELRETFTDKCTQCVARRRFRF